MLRARDGRPLVVAHRGGDAHVRANSWAAFERAVAESADLIELDVHATRDGVLVVWHPYGLPDGRLVRETDWADLAAGFDSEERPPVLGEVLDWSRQHDAVLAVDVKGGFAPRGSVAMLVLEDLRRHDALDRAVVLDFDHRNLAALKAAEPAVRTQALLRGMPVDLTAMLRDARADAVSLSYDLVRREDVVEAQAAGVAVALVDLWQPDFARAVELGVDMVSWGDVAQAHLLLAAARP